MREEEKQSELVVFKQGYGVCGITANVNQCNMAGSKCYFAGLRIGELCVEANAMEMY